MNSSSFIRIRGKIECTTSFCLISMQKQKYIRSINLYIHTKFTYPSKKHLKSILGTTQTLILLLKLKFYLYVNNFWSIFWLLMLSLLVCSRNFISWKLTLIKIFSFRFNDSYFCSFVHPLKYYPNTLNWIHAFLYLSQSIHQPWH